jgi:hypothetical protein
VGFCTRLSGDGSNTRFEQLQLRAEGWHTVQLPSVVAQLNLTEAQQKRYEQFMDGIK